MAFTFACYHFKINSSSAKFFFFVVLIQILCRSLASCLLFVVLSNPNMYKQKNTQSDKQIEDSALKMRGKGKKITIHTTQVCLNNCYWFFFFFFLLPLLCSSSNVLNFDNFVYTFVLSFALEMWKKPLCVHILLVEPVSGISTEYTANITTPQQHKHVDALLSAEHETHICLMGHNQQYL